MIYIFDDRSGRRENNKYVINKYKDKIKFVKFEKGSKVDLDEYLNNNFQDAKCVLFHKTYLLKDEDVVLNDILQAFAKITDGNVVVFSGGNEIGAIDNRGLAVVNADVMYENLELFMKDFDRSHKPNKEILLWGEKFHLNRLLVNQIKVHISKFVDCKLSDKIEICDLECIEEDIKEEEFDIKEAISNIDGDITMDIVREMIQSKVIEMTKSDK